MMNLKRLFQSGAHLVKVSRAEEELLRFFIANHKEFLPWFSGPGVRPSKVRFHFYYPTAIDFFYDDLKLFTAYFNKDAQGAIRLEQFKMSDVNFSKLRSTNWKPFQDVILHYLMFLEQRDRELQFQQDKSLHEYQELCEGKEIGEESGSRFYIKDILAAQLGFSPNSAL